MIFKKEKQVLEWIEKNVVIIALVISVIASIVIRINLKDFSSSDFELALHPWFQYYQANGIEGLKTGIGDYTKFYQFLIWGFTKIPVNDLYQYKILSAIFDYALAALVAYFVYQYCGKNKNNAILSAIIVVMSPLVLLNSGAWAQCDSMYVICCLAALVALIKEKNLLAFVMLGIGFTIKIQMIFIIPFIVLYYVIKKKFSIIYFAIIPAIMMLSTLPAIIMGASPFTIFSDYTSQAEKFTKMTLNYPSFWQILNDGQTVDSLDTMKLMAIITTVVVLGIQMLYWINKKAEFTSKNMVLMAFLLSYEMVLFLPLMHERYGFLYEILALIIIFYNKKTIPLAIGLILLSMQTYGCFLFDAYVNLQLISVFNMVIFVAYLVILNRMILGER